MTATAHKILTAPLHPQPRRPLPRTRRRVLYSRDTENGERYRRRLIRQLERPGHKVTLKPLPEAA
jgi:hypothetical protein